LFAIVSLKLSEALKMEVEITQAEMDALTDLEGLRDRLVNSLEPYLRIQVQKRGLTIIQNTYAGYDTEYKLVDSKKNLNKLVSTQTAIHTRTFIKIPLYRQYDISYAHPLTSEITTFFNPKFGS
jgi:hypothetical protein